ncbi:MAG: DnaJ domain-containing protein [Deltaproteobacteria bacterium]|nr:DnaJ domain-containing protein [Deltaproteobacteria bacterium]
MNPYEILGITPKTDDKAVRASYLKLLKRYSPESEPEKFKMLNNAYNALKDEKSRNKYFLFNTDTWIDSPFEALFDHCKTAEGRIPPGPEKMKEFLKECAAK